MSGRKSRLWECCGQGSRAGRRWARVLDQGVGNEPRGLGRADGDSAQGGEHQAMTMRNQRLPQGEVEQRGRYEDGGGLQAVGLM